MWHGLEEEATDPALPYFEPSGNFYNPTDVVNLSLVGPQGLSDETSEASGQPLNTSSEIAQSAELTLVQWPTPEAHPQIKPPTEKLSSPPRPTDVASATDCDSASVGLCATRKSLVSASRAARIRCLRCIN